MSQKIFFALGTASQVPTRERNHNGYFVRWNTEGFLLDPGEGTQRQMTFAGVSAAQITKIFITHFHGDHCLGLPGVLQRISLDQVSHAVEIYFPEYGREFIHNLRNSSIYYNTAQIVEKPFSKSGVIFQDDNLTIETLPLEHSVESWGYRFTESNGINLLPEKLKEFGISGKNVGILKKTGSIEINGKIVSANEVGVQKRGITLAFAMDTKICDAIYELAKDVDFFVCESTYLASEIAEAEKNKHLTALQAAQIAQDSNVGKLVLTHFSRRYNLTKDFADEAQTIFGNVSAVSDGEQIEILRK